MKKEICIRCGRETEYDVSTPITARRYYVEGSGQLCHLCYQELYGVAPSLGISSGGGLDEKQTTAATRKE